MPSSRPAVSDVTTVESAPDCSSRCWFSASRTAAMILAVGRQLARGERDQHRGVVAVGGDDDRLGVLRAGQPQHLGIGRVAAHGDQAGGVGPLEGGGVVVDDDDVAGRHLVADHRGDRRPALGAVADDDGVVAHAVSSIAGSSTPGATAVVSVSTVVPISTIRNATRSGVITRTLTSRADSRERGDVAIAGGRQRHRRVVEAVQERQSVALDVDVAVAVEVDDQHRREQRQHGVDDAADDPLASGSTGLRGMRSAVDECMAPAGSVSDWSTPAEPPAQTTSGHGSRSSVRAGAQHNVTHDLAPTRTPADRQSPRRAVRLGAMLLGIGTLHFVAPKPFDTIVPAELPGSAPVLHLRLRGGRAGHRRCAAGAAHPAAAVRWPRWRCSCGVSRPTSTWCGCGGTSPGRCGSSRSPGCRCRSRWSLEALKVYRTS